MPAKGTIKIDELYCKGCELCVGVCPQNVLALAMDRITAKGYHPAQLTGEGCTGCAVCALICPEASITVYRDVLKVTRPALQEA